MVLRTPRHRSQFCFVTQAVDAESAGRRSYAPAIDARTKDVGIRGYDLQHGTSQSRAASAVISRR
jgi:hypothetical protein